MNTGLRTSLFIICGVTVTAGLAYLLLRNPAKIKDAAPSVYSPTDSADSKPVELSVESPALGQARTNVVYYLNLVKQTKAQNAAANKNRDLLHQTYKGKELPTATYNAVMKRYKAADDAIIKTQQSLEAATRAFEKALTEYNSLGGKTDYRQYL